MKTHPVFFLLPLIALMGCADIYHSPDAKTLSSSHKTIAIAPPRISIEAQKKVDADALEAQQRAESATFQQEMYSWLLKRKMQNRIFVEVQDVETTNAKLRQAGYFDTQAMSPNEIADLLGVDGIITSTYNLSKPMSEAGAIASGVLLGYWGSTNRTAVTLGIHDHSANKLIWSYNHKASGTIGSSPVKLVDDLMRKASKKMPYVNDVR